MVEDSNGLAKVARRKAVVVRYRMVDVSVVVSVATHAFQRVSAIENASGVPLAKLATSRRVGNVVLQSQLVNILE